MMTDTGGFTYNSNNREIYFIISELLSKGSDKDEIYRKVFNTYSESRLQMCIRDSVMNVHYEACPHLHCVVQQIREAGMLSLIHIYTMLFVPD